MPFLSVAGSADKSDVLRGERASPGQWDHVIELDSVVRDRLMADLAYLGIAPDYLQHDVVWDASSGPPSRLCLGDSLSDIEDWTNMPEDGALKFCRVVLHDPSPLRRIGIEETVARIRKFVVGARASSGEDCSALSADKAHVAKLPCARSERKLRNQWAIGAILQFPARLADRRMEPRPLLPGLPSQSTPPSHAERAR